MIAKPGYKMNYNNMFRIDHLGYGMKVSLILIREFMISDVHMDDFRFMPIKMISPEILSMKNNIPYFESNKMGPEYLHQFLHSSRKSGRKNNGDIINGYLSEGIPLNIVSIKPAFLTGTNQETKMIPDNIFKEVFGATSGDFIKASNSVYPNITERDRGNILKTMNTSFNIWGQAMHINGKVIANGEFLQMADIKFDTLVKTIENLDNTSTITIIAPVKYSMDERRTTETFIDDDDLSSNILGKLFVIREERNFDPFYKPSIDRYDVIYENNELKTQKV
jgi:hypothetical protein